MTFETITFTVEGGVGTLTLNRPEKLNALIPQLLQEIRTVISGIDGPDGDVRALLLTGAGRGFSSGADLSPDHQKMETAELLEQVYHPVIEGLHALPVPIVTALNGPAAGAGMSLALCGDIIIAAESAYFLQAFVNIGLVPDAGSTWMLPRLVGSARAKAAMMLGEKISAAKALEWGLVYDVVTDDAVMTRATAIAARLAKGPTLALSSIRVLAKQSTTNDLTAQLALEATIQSRLSKSEDCLEGIGAFVAKREAQFKGR